MSNFKYTYRSDGRLMKRVSVNGSKISIYSKDVKDLERQYIELKHQNYNNINYSESITLKQFALKWLKLNSVGKEYNTIRENKHFINNYIIPYLGAKKLKDIKIYDIKELLSKLENKKTSSNKLLALIKRILNDAVDNDLIVKNVASNIKAQKIISKEKIPLTEYEDKLLLDSSNKHALFFILMRYTGMRREEIVPLTKNDIDFKNKTIVIHNAVEFINNKPRLKTTKNGKKRKVPILDIIYNRLKKYVKNIHNPHDLLFVTELNKEMLTATAIRRHLESLRNSLNKISNKPIYFTCHTLRHSYCTMLYYAGIKVKKAQELMGHSSSKMVLDVYTHLDEEKENAKNTLDNFLNSKNKRTLKLKKLTHFLTHYTVKIRYKID